MSVLFSFLAQTKGSINLDFNAEQFKEIHFVPFVDIFLIGGQEFLERLTATPSDEAMLDSCAEELGFPKKFSALTDTILSQDDLPSSVCFELTNGETSISVDLKT